MEGMKWIVKIIVIFFVTFVIFFIWQMFRMLVCFDSYPSEGSFFCRYRFYTWLEAFFCLSFVLVSWFVVKKIGTSREKI